MNKDITFCVSECPIKNKCLRWKEYPDEPASYSNFYNKDDKECEYMIPIELLSPNQP